MSEGRRIKRSIEKRIYKDNPNTGDSETTYISNNGEEYPFKWVAKTVSFLNIFLGCLKNGFPIAVSKLWYVAWAFYPFFFIRKDLRIENPIPILNHERIHIRQQRDIHLTISLPIIILCGIAEIFGWFNPIALLCSIPFIPTIIYGGEMIHSWINLKRSNRPITFSTVRENTCFEREAISRATNADYLFTRKFWAVLAYTGIKKFQNYGIK